MKELSLTKTIYKVSDFISWKRVNNLILSPYFQRRDVWSVGAKSFLLDTIYRGLPTPIIILREQKSDIWKLEPIREVVDGQQRLRAVFSYIDSSLLENFNPGRDEFTISKTHNKWIGGKRFNQLDMETKQRLLDYEFSVHVLPADVDDRLVLEIFSRLNATGVKLNSQELRNAKYFGEFKTMAYKLAMEQLFRWRKWQVFSDLNIARMEEVELTSDLIQFMICGIVTRNRASLNNLYHEKDEVFNEKEEVKKRFRIVMDTIDEYYSEKLIDSIFSKKTLFYSLFSIVYSKQFGIQSDLLTKIKTKPVSHDVFRGIQEAEATIVNEQAEQTIIEAFGTRRTTNAGQRRIILGYLESFV